jgi:hypothetical protein
MRCVLQQSTFARTEHHRESSPSHIDPARGSPLTRVTYGKPAGTRRPAFDCPLTETTGCAACPATSLRFTEGTSSQHRAGLIHSVDQGSHGH